MKGESSGIIQGLRATIKKLARPRRRSPSTETERNPVTTSAGAVAESPKQEQQRPLADVIHLDERREATAKSSDPWDRPLSEVPRASPPSDLVDESRREAFGVMMTASAAVLVTGGCLWKAIDDHLNPSLTIRTSIGESKRHLLYGGVIAWLGARTTLQVDGRGKHERVTLLEGEAMFDVPAGLDRPFEMLTYLARANAAVCSRFVVVVDTSVMFAVHDGQIAVTGRGRKQPINLKQGMKYRFLMDALV